LVHNILKPAFYSPRDFSRILDNGAYDKNEISNVYDLRASIPNRAQPCRSEIYVTESLARKVQ